MIKNYIKGVFFDLDGTLLDTAPDLLRACNYVLEKYQFPRVTIEEFRYYISAGTESMICNSFKISTSYSQYLQIRKEFLDYYQQYLTISTSLFPNINKVLNYLDQTKILWGIVTGKSTDLARPLLKYFSLDSKCHCLVGGDTISPGKPSPAPLLHACSLLNLLPTDCIYIGDEYTDVCAAKAAEMKAIAVTYGYASRSADPHQWNADFVINSANDLLNLLSS